MKRLFFVLLVVALSGVASPAYASDYITTTEVEDCVEDDSGIDCEAKIKVGVAVAFGRPVTLGAVMVSGDPPVEETTTIEIEMSRQQVLYPLVHFHTVPYYPYEEVIMVPNPDWKRQACLDGATSASPTCMWTYQGSFQIEDSQGFCCNKGSVLTPAAAAKVVWRGEEGGKWGLDQRSTWRNPFSTAHCLRNGELFFHGYEMVETQPVDYEITVKVTRGSDEYTFKLTPPDPLYDLKTDVPTSTIDMRAELVGLLNEYWEPPELDNHILYIPSAPDTHEMVQNYQNNLLLVPRDEVSRDGTECNKVGTSFYAFRRQGGQCGVSRAGDCLHNQLFHKHNDDLQELIVDPDAETTYLVHGMRRFKGAMDFKTGMEKYLIYQPETMTPSLISLTFDADSIKMITTESEGTILEAYVMEFDSMSREGRMLVKIKNDGSIKTDYIVGVSDCNMNIVRAIPAKAITVDSLEEIEVVFDIHTAYNLSTANECTVTLKSPTDKQYDEVLVEFNTLKHHSSYPWTP